MNAVKVMQVATGEEGEEFDDDGKDPAAKAPGAKDGEALARKLSPEQRSASAQQAAAKRWSLSPT